MAFQASDSRQQNQRTDITESPLSPGSPEFTNNILYFGASINYWRGLLETQDNCAELEDNQCNSNASHSKLLFLSVLRCPQCLGKDLA